MDIAVRYYSKLGNTKIIAQAIAKGSNIKEKSIVEEPKLIHHVDILFLGGAPYANIMAPELRQYATELEKEKVDYVVLFTTSNWSRRTIKGLRNILTAKGIKVYDKYFYAHMTRVKYRIVAAKEFAENVIKNIMQNA